MNRNSACMRLIRACTCLVLLAGFPSFALAQGASDSDTVERHPLELRALSEPEAVRQEIPALMQAAIAAKDFKLQALLSLAESNACRVIADWPCQASAAARARAAAESAQLPLLQARGLILESRGRMAMQDFSRAGQTLSVAERLLAKNPSPVLSADVFLAYSSLSYTVGKHALAADYAKRGLDVLGKESAPLIRIRLLRNQARAMAQLNDMTGAQAVLKNALELVETIRDPKLTAELHLEDARIARLAGDITLQRTNGERVLALADTLKNSQLRGLGHEILGLAALGTDDKAEAERQLTMAYDSFRALKLDRDERRVLRALLRSVLGRNVPRERIEALVARSIALETAVEADDRNMAADDFEARLKYAQQELDVQRLEASAALAAERASSLASEQRATLIATGLSIGLLVVVGFLLVLQRRFNSRLKEAVTQAQESELRYRVLADNTRDLVIRMRPDGHRLYVSPSINDMLGYAPEDLAEPRWDLVHPEDLPTVARELRALGERGGSATVVYRARHRDGHWVWIEVLARRVESPTPGAPPEIIYSGRDVSTRVMVEKALAESEGRMRAIADNMPAMIAHLDREQRYTFVNAYVGQIYAVDERTLIGKTIRELRGEKVYADTLPHINTVLTGQAVTFEGDDSINGEDYHYQAHLVPDRDANGEVNGFYSLIFNITDLQRAKSELDRLVRTDSLTGVANRRLFNERLGEALLRSRRHGTALALLWLDIDHFKSINDRFGHAAGDAVIMAFADTLQSCVRADDLVARLGGDEFVVLIENAGTDSGEVVAQKLLGLMQEPVVSGEHSIHASASIGVAYSAHPTSAEALLHAADQALYAAKGAGRNTFRSVTAPEG
jgi:diguanylate cyclase (GGDEF)-like protein/PAS domain S-box-containing protein